MALQKALEEDLKSSIKAGDGIKKNTLRLALSEIKLVSVAQSRPLNDEEIVGVLRKQVQARQETIADASRAGRADLVSEAEAEILVLDSYLPPPLPVDELDRLVEETIAEVGAESPADLGKVMKVLMPRLKGRAAGGEVSQLVREKLNRNG